MILFHTDDAVLSDLKRLARSPALAAADTPAKMSGRMISRPDIVQAIDLSGSVDVRFVVSVDIATLGGDGESR